MGFSESHILSKVALAVLPVGCLFVIIGTATNNWYSYSLDSLGLSQSASSGLWKACSDSTCITFEEIPDYLKTVRAFAILSILLAVGGMAVIVLALMKNEVTALQIVAITIPAAAALCAFISVGVYGGEYASNVPAIARDIVKLSWSFALVAVGGCLDAVAAILYAIGFFVTRS